jgi:nucleolar complex protein 3
LKCRDALEILFKNDEQGKACLEAVSMISKMVKERNYRVHPSVYSSLYVTYCSSSETFYICVY